jgi:hypothetical protein
MNFLLTLVIIAGTCLPLLNCEEKSELQKDFDEILMLIPDKKIKTTILKYVIFDKEVFDLLVFLRGPECQKAWTEYFELKTVKKLLDYLELEGVDAYGNYENLLKS